MPTYEYACHDCGTHLEVVQSFKDEPLRTCGSCGGRLRKVFTAAGIIFKGSGYYSTDYGRTGAGSRTAASDDSGTDSEKSDSDKSDSEKSEKSDKSETGSEKKSSSGDTEAASA